MTPLETRKAQLREYIEARAKATQGRMTSYIAESKKGSNYFNKAIISWNPPEYPDENLILHQWKLNDFDVMSMGPARQNVHFFAKAANESALIAEQLLECIEALEFATEELNKHREAYSEDIFPDDGRKPCETTSARMGRHMIKCFDDYLSPVQRALKKIAGEK